MEIDKEEIIEETNEGKTGYSVGNLIPTSCWDFSIPKIDISGAVKALTQYSNIVGSCVFGMTDRWSKISDSIVRIATGYTESLSKIGSIASNIISFLDRIDYSPLVRIAETLSRFDFGKFQANLERIYYEALYGAKWFPHAVCTTNLKLFEDINDILASTRSGSQNRTKKLDKVIFSYYNKKTLTELKRLWKGKDLPPHIKRILGQAIDAYKRKEYALTVSALATLWEGFIEEKAATEVGYRKGKKIKEELAQLLKENSCSSVAQLFCEEYIFYDCCKPSEVKADVPGRHCIAHSWYDDYPNRKTALNAIIFTDFLLGLDIVAVKD